MNTKFCFEKTEIDGLYKVIPFNADDIRGSFTKDYSNEVFSAAGIDHKISEIFYTTSHKGVIRAIHFQRVKQQPKLVRCIYGSVYDVVVDLRKNSKTFKQYVAFELNSTNHLEILVPAGCGHGYLVCEDNSVVSYKCAEKFYAEFDSGIVWNDPELNIDWPISRVGGLDKIILAEKDKKLQTFNDFISNGEDF